SHHAAAQLTHMERTAVEIDIAAIRRTTHLDHLRAQPLEKLRSQVRRRTVPAIHNDLEPIQPAGKSRKQIIEIPRVKRSVHLERLWLRFNPFGLQPKNPTLDLQLVVIG